MPKETLTETPLKKYKIDVDVIIERYNTANPTLKQLDRKELAKQLGCNKQILSDWKRGVTPDAVSRLFKLVDLSANARGQKLKFEDFITEFKPEE